MCCSDYASYQEAVSVCPSLGSRVLSKHRVAHFEFRVQGSTVRLEVLVFSQRPSRIHSLRITEKHEQWQPHPLIVEKESYAQPHTSNPGCQDSRAAVLFITYLARALKPPFEPKPAMFKSLRLRPPIAQVLWALPTAGCLRSRVPFLCGFQEAPVCGVATGRGFCGAEP